MLLGKPLKIEAIQGLVNFDEDEAENVKLESENPENAVFEENEIVEIEETEYLVEHGEEVSEDCFESQQDHEIEAELYTVEEIIDEDFSDQQQPEQSFIICESQISNRVQVSPPKKVLNAYRKQPDAPGQCAACGKSYKNLRAHLKTHQEKPEKKFECDKCGELFRFKSYIYRHMNYIHINAKK